MKRNNYLPYALSLAIAASFSAHSLADDTEIFFNTDNLNNNEDYQPNVLFIFDTSGSMGWNITTQEDYNPATDYGTPGTNDTIYVYNSSLSYQNRSIASSRNSCQAMIDHIASTPDTPIYVGKAAEWRDRSGTSNDRWINVRDSNRTVECQEDAGVHGIDDTSPDLYAANGANGPYTDTENQAIGWGGIDTRWYVSENYHQYQQTAASVTRVKMDVMKEAAVDLVNEFSGLNFGLMRFDGSNGGYVKHHFSDIETDKTNIISSINALNANGNTPLSETLWEAHKYFLGGSVEYGTNSDRDPLAVSGGNYNSPVADSDSSCQKNYIVYLTDGTPYSDSGRDATISGLTSSCSHQDGTSSSSHTCLDELAGYMATYDYNDDLDDTQNVQTYTIGFDIDMDLLEQTAINGLGTYHTVSSSQELKTAFNEIIVDILSKSTTFTAPAVSVNAFNALQHRDELYYAIFEPNKYPRWHGNVKKYRINSLGEVLDVNDQDAIDPNTGYFTSSAESFWSGVTDGSKVQAGGAASKLGNNRTVFTVSGDATASNISLNTSANTITLTNTAITNEQYGLDSLAPPLERAELIGWILGADTQDEDADNDVTDPTRFMADPLHSQPTVVTYDGDFDNKVLDDTIFITSNDGSFRAIDADDGTELFSFIPQDLLSNQLDYYTDDPDGVRRYGLDGPMTIWRQESSQDEDIKIESADGDHVYAYVGMRRGGSNYYALDVTDRANPVLKWTIFGGSAGFQDMGQTWSKPIRSRVKWDCDSNGENCDTKDVLFFGGGYDTIHDTADTPTSGDAGAAIYMVDAESGALLWSAGNNNDNSPGDDTHDLNIAIQNSITGNLALGDMNGDGYDDIIFAVDILGHVWRIDINNKNTMPSNFAFKDTGNSRTSEIADLSQSGVLRRFYNSPTVSLSLKQGRPPFFVITIGSGYIAHPKETDVVDRLYAIFEYNLFGPPKDGDGNVEYSTIDNGDLLNLTDPNDGPADPEGNAPHGFYKNATEPGEKFLRRALTLFGLTLYSSYLPESSNQDTTCGSAFLGGSRLYGMDFVTGESIFSGGYVDLKHPGIAPEPVALLIPDDEGRTRTTVCVGTECFHSGGASGTSDGKCAADDADCIDIDEPSITIKSWRENRE
ncbi:MAG: PilC/PilY family type IV pilus protein [Porticoccaceae bacterium]|nr:hypothetical protein [Pseudomonadales bacterium]MCP5172509.1 hypothetical protein [Pseudomonadales bacterium]